MEKILFSGIPSKVVTLVSSILVAFLIWSSFSQAYASLGITIANPPNGATLNFNTVDLQGDVFLGFVSSANVDVSIDDGPFTRASTSQTVAGLSSTLYFWRFTTPPLPDGLHKITARITDTSGQTAQSSETFTIDTTNKPQAALFVASSTPTTATLGVPFDAKIGVGNDGPGTAENPSLQVILPPGLQVNGASIVTGTLFCNLSGQSVNCTFPNLPPSGADVFTLNLTPTQPGQQTIFGTAFASNPNPNPIRSDLAAPILVNSGTPVPTSLSVSTTTLTGIVGDSLPVTLNLLDQSGSPIKAAADTTVNFAAIPPGSIQVLFGGTVTSTALIATGTSSASILAQLVQPGTDQLVASSPGLTSSSVTFTVSPMSSSTNIDLKDQASCQGAPLFGTWNSPTCSVSSFTFNPGDSLFVDNSVFPNIALIVTGGLTNSGGSLTIGNPAAGGGATLTVNSGNLNMNGGTLTVNSGNVNLNGGTLTVNSGNVNLNGGTVNLSGSGDIIMNGNIAIAASSVNISASGNVGISSGGDLGGAGGVGTITGGTVTLSSASGSINGGGTINAGSVTLSASGNIGSSAAPIKLSSSSSTLSATSGGSVFVSSTGSLTLSSVTAGGSGGTVSINSNSGSISIGGPVLANTVTLNGGSIAGSTSGGITANTVSLSASGSIGPLNLSSTTGNVNLSATSSGGSISLSSSGSLTLANIAAGGNVDLSSSGDLVVGSTITAGTVNLSSASGLITLGPSSSITANTVNLNTPCSSTITSNGIIDASTININNQKCGTFSNSGSLTIRGATTIGSGVTFNNNGGKINLVAGATIDNGGNFNILSGPFTLDGTFNNQIIGPITTYHGSFSNAGTAVFNGNFDTTVGTATNTGTITVTCTGKIIGTIGGVQPVSSCAVPTALSLAFSSLTGPAGAQIPGQVTLVGPSGNPTNAATDTTVTFAAIPPGSIQVLVGGTVTSTALIATGTSSASILAQLVLPGTDQLVASSLGLTSSSVTFTVTNPLTGTPTNITPVEGNLFTGTVAHFIDTSNPNALPSDFTGTIDWGDGTTSPATLVTNPTGGFDVSGTRTYTDEGSFSLSITINGNGGLTTTVTGGTANVADAKLSVVASNINAIQGNPFTGTFRLADANLLALPTDFTGTINWGDGTIDRAIITSTAAGSFDVTGTHTYATSGVKPFSLRIDDNGGSTVTATSTVTVAPPLSASASASPNPAMVGNTINLNAAVSGGLSPYSFSWKQTGGPPVTLSSLTGDTVSFVPDVPGTYQFVVTVLDKSGQTATSSLSLTVLSPAQATQNLITFINSLNLDHGITSSLDSKLNAALASLNSNHDNAAKNQLKAFENYLQSQRQFEITLDIKNKMMTTVQNIINAIH